MWMRLGEIVTNLDAAEAKYAALEARYSEIATLVEPLLSPVAMTAFMAKGRGALTELREVLDFLKVNGGSESLWASWNNAADVTAASWGNAKNIANSQATKVEISQWLNAWVATMADFKKELLPDLGDLGWLKWAAGAAILLMAFNLTRK